MESAVSNVVRVAFGPRRPRAGRPIVVEGIVQHGDKRGRELGFPTANLMIDDKMGKDGVWAGTVELESGDVLAAAVSLGRRVTFYERDGVRLLEAHLLDFGGDLYDQRIVVVLHRLLRPQQRFDGVDALVEQMHRDIDDTRTWAESLTASPVALTW